MASSQTKCLLGLAAGFLLAVAPVTAQTLTWYVLCDPGTGDVTYADEATDSLKQMAGPFPGPGTAQAWIDAHCADWRCDAKAVCEGSTPPAATRPSSTGGSNSGGWSAGPARTVGGTGSEVSNPRGTDSAGGDWSGGAVKTIGAPSTTVAGRGRGGVAPVAADMTALIGGATSAAEACSFHGALAMADQIARIQPKHVWLTANHQKIKRLKRRQQQTEGSVMAAANALSAGNLKGAQRSAGHAAETAVSCQTQAVGDLLVGINKVITQKRLERQQANRRGMASLVPSLLGLANTITAAKYGGAGSASTASALASSLTSGLSGGAGTAATGLGGIDACAHKYAFANMYSPTPSCTCPGYSFDGRTYSCTNGSGSGGGSASALNTVMAGITAPGSASTVPGSAPDGWDHAIAGLVGAASNAGGGSGPGSGWRTVAAGVDAAAASISGGGMPSTSSMPSMPASAALSGSGGAACRVLDPTGTGDATLVFSQMKLGQTTIVIRTVPSSEVPRIIETYTLEGSTLIGSYRDVSTAQREARRLCP